MVKRSLVEFFSKFQGKAAETVLDLVKSKLPWTYNVFNIEPSAGDTAAGGTI